MVKKSLIMLVFLVIFVPTLATAQNTPASASSQLLVQSTTPAAPKKGSSALERVRQGARYTAEQSDLIARGATPEPLEVRIGRLVGVGLSLMGIVFFILTLYAGFLWMFSRGNEEQGKKAVDIITAAISGLVVVAGAYAITNFVLTTALPQPDPVLAPVDPATLCEGQTYNGRCVPSSDCSVQDQLSRGVCADATQVCCSGSATGNFFCGSNNDCDSGVCDPVTNQCL